MDVMLAHDRRNRKSRRDSPLALGTCVVTRGVSENPAVMAEVPRLLQRHATGDWGDLDEHDRAENELGVREGFRVMSVYTVAGATVWVITEADRSSTCVLFPDEY